MVNAEFTFAVSDDGLFGAVVGDRGGGDGFAVFIDDLSFDGDGLAHAEEREQQGEQASRWFHCLKVWPPMVPRKGTREGRLKKLVGPL